MLYSCQAPLGTCNLFLQTIFADRFRMRPEWAHAEAIAAFQQRRRECEQGCDSQFAPAPSPSLRTQHPALQNASLAAYFVQPTLDWAEHYESQRSFVMGDMNFGLIEIDWQRTLVSLQARRAWDGKIAFEEVIPFGELRPESATLIDTELCARPIEAWRLWPAEVFIPWILASLFLLALALLALVVWCVRRVWRGVSGASRAKQD